MKSNLSFVTLHTADYDRARAFFVDILGFEPTEERPGANAFVSTSGAGLALRENKALKTPLGQGVTVFFTVPDLQAYHDQLTAAGVELIESMHEMPFGSTFTVATPDGQWLGFWQGEG